jgi:hypothetical protein
MQSDIQAMKATDSIRKLPRQIAGLNFCIAVSAALFLAAFALHSAKADDAGTMDSTASPTAFSSYAIIISSNTSPRDAENPLRYADDDAVKNYMLFRMLTPYVYTYSLLDAETQQVFPWAKEYLKAPTRAALAEALNKINDKISADHQAGRKARFYFVYSGHGNVDENRNGEIYLSDGPLTRTDLFREIIAKSQADFNHIILDACFSYFMVQGKGGEETEQTFDEYVKAYLAHEELSAYPNTGVFLSTAAKAKSHEWAEYDGGIFSHQIRSGLSGAADADGDGKITYQELAAFLAAANGGVEDQRARIQVFARPPQLDHSAPIFETGFLENAFFLEIPATAPTRVSIDTTKGRRWIDANLSMEKGVHLALPAHQGYWVRIADNEAALKASAGQAVSWTALSFAPIASSGIETKGALAELFVKGLFTIPYGYSFYRGYALTQLNPDGAQRLYPSASIADAAKPTAQKREHETSAPSSADRQIAMAKAQPDSQKEELKRVLSVAVFPVEALVGVLPDTTQLIGEDLLSRIRDLQGVKAVGMQEINVMIGLEQQKQLIGCTEFSCMAEIGGALGVDQILLSSLGKLGDQYVYNLKLLDMRTATPAGNYTIRIKEGQEKEFFLQNGPAVSHLFPGFEPQTPPIVSVQPFPQEGSEKPASILTWVGWPTLGAGVTLAGLGGYYFSRTKNAKDKIDESKTLEEKLDSTDSYSKNTNIRNGLLIGGSVLVGTGIILLIIDAVLGDEDNIDNASEESHAN